jgi:methylase of polypeptide subunit release factors
MHLMESSALGSTGERLYVFRETVLTLRLAPSVSSPNYYTDLVVDNLEGLDVEGRTILDLGCGTGLITILLSRVLGAEQVWAIDIDPGAVALTKSNSRLNGCDLSRMHLMCSDIRTLPARLRLDLIIANPPQIPTPELQNDQQCSGGWTGRKVIQQIVEFSSRALTRGGRLVMTAAEFVDIGELESYSSRRGMALTTLASRLCRPGPYTMRFREHIERSGYRFPVVDGWPCFMLHLVALEVA